MDFHALTNKRAIAHHWASADRDKAPIVCLSRREAENERLVEAILNHGWRPVNAAITSAAHLLEMNPMLGVMSPSAENAVYAKLRRRGCHIVSWSRLPSLENACPFTVCPDHRAYGQLAAEHLAERGFRQIAYLGWMAHERLQTMYQGLQERGAELDMTVHLYDLDTTKVKRAETWWGEYEKHLKDFKSWLDQVGTPIGILTMDDRLAARCCMHCHELGLTVPVDVGILGQGNNIGICECSPVLVSSIIPDTEREIAACIDLLSRGLDGPVEGPIHVLCPPQGIALRESTDVLASVDKDVAMALRFIWRNYRKNISVDDVAQAVGMRRFQLERAFKKELDRGINEELCRRRMDVFVELLETTDELITNLCSASGFFSPAHLFRRFKRVYGMTPSQYRARMAKR